MFDVSYTVLVYCLSTGSSLGKSTEEMWVDSQCIYWLVLFPPVVAYKLEALRIQFVLGKDLVIGVQGFFPRLSKHSERSKGYKAESLNCRYQIVQWTVITFMPGRIHFFMILDRVCQPQSDTNVLIFSY